MPRSVVSESSSTKTARPSEQSTHVSFNNGGTLEISAHRNDQIYFGIGDAYYLGVPQRKPLWEITHSMCRPLPRSEACTVTVFNTLAVDKFSVGQDYLESRMKAFDAFLDDIWSREDFLDGLLVNVLPTQEEGVRKMMNRAVLPSRWWAVISQPGLPDGPYLTLRDTLYQVYRLYEDRSESEIGEAYAPEPRRLLRGDLPAADSCCISSVARYKPLGLFSKKDTFFIAVASRIVNMFQGSKRSFLHGKRIAVSMNYDWDNLCHALGNACFDEITLPGRTPSKITFGTTATNVESWISMPSTFFWDPFGDNPGLPGLVFHGLSQETKDAYYRLPDPAKLSRVLKHGGYRWLDLVLRVRDSPYQSDMDSKFCLRYHVSRVFFKQEVRTRPTAIAVPVVLSNNTQTFECLAAALCGHKVFPPVNQAPNFIVIAEAASLMSDTIDTQFKAFTKDLARAWDRPAPLRGDWIYLYKSWMRHDQPDCDFVAYSHGYNIEDQRTYDDMIDPLRNIPWDTFVYAFTDESDDWHRDYWKYARKDSGLGPIAEDKRRTSVCTLHGSGGCSETCLQIRKLREYRDWLVRVFLRWPEDNTIIIIPHQKRAPLKRWRNPGGPQMPGTVYAGHYIWLSDILGCARIDVPVTRVQYDPKDPTPLLEYDPLWVSVLSAPGTDLMLVRAVARLFEERAEVAPWVPKYWPSWKSWNAPAAPPENLAPAASSENLETSSGRGSDGGNESGGGSGDGDGSGDGGGSGNAGGSGDGSGSGKSKQKGKQKADDNAV